VTLLDQASDLAQPYAADWVRFTDHQLRSRGSSFQDELETTVLLQADMIGPQQLDRVFAPDTPPYGVFGAGLFRNGLELTFVPALFVMPELLGRGGSESVEVIDATKNAPELAFLAPLGLMPPGDGVVVALPVPRELGIRVTCDFYGTIGTPVWLEDDRKAILTAGHVAKTVGAIARVEDHPIGPVVYSNHRGLHKSPEASADVGVIALNDDALDIVGKLDLKHVGSAAKLDRVRAFNYSGTGSKGEVVRSIHETFAVDEKTGEWEDVAVVDLAISVDGDSGSVVVDSHGALVGQIVGGHPPTYSLVQNIDLLLKDSRTRVRF
jgi:hypothetical protein